MDGHSGNRLFKVKSGSGSAERKVNEMTGFSSTARMKDIVEYKKSVTTDEPNAYAEVVLKFEGVSEERTDELRQIFNRFYAKVEAIVCEETSPLE